MYNYKYIVYKNYSFLTLSDLTFLKAWNEWYIGISYEE